MYAFEFDRPTTLQDALVALAEEDVQALAGGQTLIPTLKARLASPSKLVSLGAITELNGVCLRDDGAIAIGATTTHATVAHDVAKYYPALAALAGQIGDPAVRNRGTIGGSIANNDPSACYPAAVLASGATIVTNAREITAGDYFQGMFTTDLTEGELIVEVRFPVPQKAAYLKFHQPASRFALVGVFVAQYASGVHVAITGASDEGVFRWAEAEAALTANFDASALDGLPAPDLPMIGDIHANAEYRAHLCTVMTKRAVIAAG
jgi:carbon-monoxide dehydrogenase medium subunit